MIKLYKSRDAIFDIAQKFRGFCVSTSEHFHYSTGIIRFFTKQIATEGFSTVFGQSRCAL